MTAAPPSHSLRITQGPIPSGVIRFGLPMVLAMTLHGVFNLVDAFFVGKLHDPGVPLAAIANCDPLLMVATIVANGISTASVALIARARGANDIRGAKTAAAQSLTLVAALSLVFGIGGALFARPIAQSVGAQSDVLDLSTSYLQLMFGGIFSMILLLQLTSILRASGDARGPTYVLIAANLLNVIADPFCIDAPGILGIHSIPWLGIEHTPQWGLLGAGYATIGARLIGCIWAAWLCARQGNLLPPLRGFLPDRAMLAKLIKLGAPSSLQLVIRVAAMIAMIKLVNLAFTTDTDQSATAAFGIGIRIDMVILFGAMGWGAAASTYTGQNLGAGQPHRAARAGWVAAACAAATMILAAAAAWLFAPQIVSLFSGSEAAVQSIGVEYVRWSCPAWIFAAVGIVLSLALNGAGSTKAPALIDALVYGLLMVPTAYAGVLWGDSPRPAVWATIAVTNLVLAVVYAAWFRRGHWQTIRI